MLKNCENRLYIREHSVRFEDNRQVLTMRHLKIAGLIAVLGATPVCALQPLHENATVVRGFYAIGLADEVRKNCETISPRMLRAYNYLRALHKWARKQGYSDDQIKELTDNKLEKEALRARIRADLADRGASPENPEGYCTVGREEIAKGSVAGKLLRAR